MRKLKINSKNIQVVVLVATIMANNGIIYNLVKKLNGILYTQKNLSSNITGPTSWSWDVNQITCANLRCMYKYAVLILNRPVTQKPDFMGHFWNNATVRITVDGGTGKWDKYVSNLSQEMQNTLATPTLITGDFDSITPDVMEKYKEKGCKIVPTPDQNYTDFTKALMELNVYCQGKNLQMDYVVAVCKNSGRIDQILGNIQTLFLNKEQGILTSNTKLYIMSEDTLSWLLYPGSHIIVLPEETKNCKRPWCSLVPVGETCERVTSTGLKWNLCNQPLKFGELVSTSNTFSGSDNVTIKCSHTLLWSMKIPYGAVDP